MTDYKLKSYVLGKKITFSRAGETLSGTALDIDDECRLSVATNEGLVVTLNSGEISISKIDNNEKISE